MKRMIDNYTDCYSVSKTLRFKLIPVGKTQENLDIKRLIEEDETRAADYKKAKKLCDRYHRFFINKTLSEGKILDDVLLKKYSELFNKVNRTEDDNKKMKELENRFRTDISNSFTKNKEYKKILGQEMIKELLPNYLEKTDELELIKSFKDFTTAFSGFNTNRENMYSDEEKSTAIAYRIVHENLPRFLSNIKCYNDKNMADLINEDSDIIKNIEKNILEDRYSVKDFFTLDFFNMILSQEGIELYNTVLGGYATETKKIQGLNEAINLYRQKSKIKIPMLKPLYKMVLSEVNSKSFVIEEIKTNEELVKIVEKLSEEDSEIITSVLYVYKELLLNIEDFDISGIYIKNDITLTTISNLLYGSWDAISNSWNEDYDKINLKTKVYSDKYVEKRKAVFKKNESFSLKDILTKFDKDDISKSIKVLKDHILEHVELINRTREDCSNLIKTCQENNRNIKEDEKIIKCVKDYLDALKDFEGIVKMFLGSGKEATRDEVFYSELTAQFDVIRELDTVYNKIRNYVTKKSYSTEKFKLYFQNPQFMGGWDRNKEKDYRATLLRKEDNYYLAVIDKSDSQCLMGLKEDTGGDNYDKLNYKLISGASKSLPHVFFTKKDMKKYGASDSVISVYTNKTYAKGEKFDLKACHELIDYYKSALNQYSWGNDFNFKFSDTESYGGIDEFFREVDDQGYVISFDKVSSVKVDELIEMGKVYLFQIYNKDFSEKSHGIPSLHTMYFKALFDTNNEGKLRLCGNAEMFMRRASINKEKMIVHPANQAMKNKNPDNPKKETILPYDVYKNRRYSVDQYELHLPIIINKIPKNPLSGKDINNAVRKELKKSNNNHVIGIDRGERNLLYVVVIDANGKIVEQRSLNEIINTCNDIRIKTDYHELLDKKERERLAARKDWKTIENIKELKEGYISQVVHYICQLVEKYDAVIALEDLNSGFKNSRIKVEKQVYQKFEKMLIDKLNYMVDKKKAWEEMGGVYNGYQLADKFVSFKKMNKQNGIMFYIPAWLTSKIDPTTGFVNLLNTKYTSVENAKQFIRSFDQIQYDENEKMFVFRLDYRKFPRTDADSVKLWNLYTFGKRIEVFRNTEKNNEFDYKEVTLTDEFKKLFDEYKIDYHQSEDIRESICSKDSKDFYVRLLHNVGLMLQMRNSITGRTDVDYLISPVRNKDGNFYNSDYYKNKDSAECSLPQDADANGAYNIARKVLWTIEKFKNTEDDKLSNVNIAISNKEWLEYAQTHILKEE